MLFCAQTPFSHVQEQFTVFGDAWEAFARSFRFITFDARGTGMSQRDVPRVSADSLVIDAEAVLDAANLDRVVVNADGSSILATATCVRLAIAHPERVSHVILESPCESTRQLADTSFGRTNLALAELDWTVYVQTLFRVLLGLASREMIESSAASAAQWVDPSIGVQYIREWEAVDLANLLPLVRQPTLVTRNEGFFVPAGICQGVAAKISGAQFRQYADPTYAQMASIIGSFIGQPTEPATRDRGPGAHVQTVLFTDLVGHTEMMRRLGDARGREVLREHERITRDAIKQHGGTEIKTDGDSFMVSFGSVAAAMECAVTLQRAIAARNDGAEEPLRVRMGLNAGEPIGDEGDLFGESVILAARIKDQAGEGEIFLAEPVRHLLAGKGFVFADRGTFVPKGFEDTVRLFEVRWRE
jgi:class 3 adenylate cyclase/pimeloyl-ACP methyl ester carboxylesterase